MRLDRRAISAIARRDLTVVARSKAVMLPIVIVPLLFFIGLPIIATFALTAAGSGLRDVGQLLDQLPPVVRQQLGGGSTEAQLIVYLLQFQFASLFQIVPLMVAAVIAADSFAGEKERRTLEALLYTPTTDLELYLAKLLGPWLAALGVTLAGYVLYAVTANLLAAGVVGRLLLISPLWLVNIVWLSPALAALAMGVLVQVSARVRGFQEAYQLSGLVVIPIVALVVAQFTGVLFLDLPILAAVGALVWVVDALILWVGYRTFRRERLLLAS